MSNGKPEHPVDKAFVPWLKTTRSLLIAWADNPSYSTYYRELAKEAHKHVISILENIVPHESSKQKSCWDSYSSFFCGTSLCGRTGSVIGFQTSSPLADAAALRSVFKTSEIQDSETMIKAMLCHLPFAI